MVDPRRGVKNGMDLCAGLRYGTYGGPQHTRNTVRMNLLSLAFSWRVACC